MNKTIKKISITAGVVVTVLVLAFGANLWKMMSEFSKFTPLETGKIADGIYVVKDDIANFFILQDDARYVVIDCGMNPDKVAEEMKKTGINPDDVSAVFLTHSDGDHAGALGLFAGAKLYMSKEEEQMTDGRKSKYLWLIKAGSNIQRKDYILLNDREVVRIGDLKIESILAPGHTSGMTAYLVNDKYLFTGDILSLKDGKIAPIPAFFDMDRAQALKSVETMRGIPSAEYIFTAHWGYTDDYQTAVK